MVLNRQVRSEQPYCDQCDRALLEKLEDQWIRALYLAEGAAYNRIEAARATGTRGWYFTNHDDRASPKPLTVSAPGTRENIADRWRSAV